MEDGQSQNQAETIPRIRARKVVRIALSKN